MKPKAHAAGATFLPRPGSVADRAIAHLQSQPAAGTEVSSASLAEAIGAPAGSIIPCLQPALDAGLVFARKKGGHARSPAFWSLVDHEKAAPMTRNPYTGTPRHPLDIESDPKGLAIVEPGKPLRAADGFSESKRAERDAARSRQSIPQGRASQHVLKATAARPDATDRDAPANTSPVGGPMGTRQPAAAGPAGIRIALWSDGTLQIERPGAGDGAADLVLFTADETRALARYLDRMAAADDEAAT